MAMAKRTKKQEKADGERVARIYSRAFQGVQVPILSTPMIYGAGKAALLAGGSDEDVAAAMRPVVDRVKVSA